MENARRHSRSLDSVKWTAELIVIGASTGGPKAVQTVLESLSSPSSPAGSISEPAHIRDSDQGEPKCRQSVLAKSTHVLVPVVIAQHMPEGFTLSFAKRLNRACVFPVAEAVDNTVLEPGKVYVCPAGFVTRVVRTGDSSMILKVEHALPEEWTYRPSIDVLFESAALASQHVLAVVLTGMGSDGLCGAKVIKDKGGKVITESDESAVIYGMPRVVHQAGLSDRHVAVQDVADCVLDWLY